MTLLEITPQSRFLDDIEELKFEQHYWSTTIVTKFNEKEKILDAEIINYDTGLGELIPTISHSKAQQLLKKVT